MLPSAAMHRLLCAFLIVLPLVVLTVPVPARAGSSEIGPGREPPPSLPGDTILVPQDASTIQEAVDRAEPGGLVLISPGVYEEAVVVTTPFVTIRGTDRNRVVLDGGFALDNAIAVIEADGVAVENLTVRNYLVNGLFWSTVFGYRASYVTAYNDGHHGLSADDSRYGQFDHDYASGHPDSGFSISGCFPCDAVITDVLAEGNALGFSGTNAGGNLLVVNSEWRDNRAGVVPNTLDSEVEPPQQGVVIAGNWVHDNNAADAPATELRYPALGIGILVEGGRDDTITHNLVEGHETFGIAILPSHDERLWLTQNNEVHDNVVRASGDADLALGFPAAGGDCFSSNDFGSSLPAAIEWRNGCGSWLRDAAGGSLGADIGPLVRVLQTRAGDVEVGDWRSQPPPPEQPSMPNASTAPPLPALAGESVPERIHIRDTRTLDVHVSSDFSREVTVLGTPLATTWWGVLLGLYAYALPLILYSAWISIALWDLVRQDAVPNRVRLGWMVAVIAVPVLGPVAYYAFGRSPIQGSLRLMLVAGGMAIYLVLATLGVLLGA